MKDCAECSVQQPIQCMVCLQEQLYAERIRADQNQDGYDRIRREQNRVVAAEELGQVAERMEAENWATDASVVRSALHELLRLRAKLETSDGEHVCAAGNGEADHACFMEGTAERAGDACGGDGWFRCPECALYRKGEDE